MHSKRITSSGLLPTGRYLISQGANVGVVNSEGETPLDIAEEEAMEELLQNEINRQGAAWSPPPPSHVHGTRARHNCHRDAAEGKRSASGMCI